MNNLDRNADFKNRITFGEWMENSIKQGYTQIVIDLLRTLPEEKKKKYREIYKRIQEKK